MQNEIIYAPIIIPTLNRCVHLKRCIHSLSLNTSVNNTDIYISVDYPPSKKYEKGYQEVVDYLKSTDDLKAFRYSKIFFQKSNLGAIRNTEFLKKEVKKVFDCYIYTEDDNEFSVNFLEYINKGLVRYKLNQEVISVNAMKDVDWIVNGTNNVVASKLFPAYGYGTWFVKEEEISKHLNDILLDKSNWKISQIKKIYKKNKYLFALYINGIVCNDSGLFFLDNCVRMCDTTLAIYMYFTETFCVVPIISKSRNWGNDGSGMTMPSNPNIDPQKRWVLDSDTGFEYIDNNIKYDSNNDKITERFLVSTLGTKLIYRALVEYFILFVLRYNREWLLKIRRRFKRI